MDTRYPSESELILAALDIKNFNAISEKLTGKELFHLLNGYFERIDRLVMETGGEMLKIMGDCVLIVYPSESPRSVVDTLRNLQNRATEYLLDAEFDSGIRIKALPGMVTIGMLGGQRRKCLDIVGEPVNQLFLLEEGDFNLSAELQARLEE